MRSPVHSASVKGPGVCMRVARALACKLWCQYVVEFIVTFGELSSSCDHGRGEEKEAMR